MLFILYQTYCGTDFFLTRIETTAFVWIHPEFFFGTQDMVKLAQLDAVLLCAAIEFFGSNRHGGFRSFRFKEKHPRLFRAMSTPELVTYSNPLRRLSFFVQKISLKYRKKIDETLGFHFRGSESCPGNFGTQKTSLNNQRWGVSPHPESISSLVCCFGGPVEIIERCFQTLLSVFVWKDEFVGASKIPQKGRNELL